MGVTPGPGGDAPQLQARFARAQSHSALGATAPTSPEPPAAARGRLATATDALRAACRGAGARLAPTILTWGRDYKRSYLKGDVIAAVTVGLFVRSYAAARGGGGGVEDAGPPGFSG